MKEVRLSIPFIGGITVIYTHDEVQAMKRSIKNSFYKAGASVMRVGGKAFGFAADRIEGKPITVSTACPACGAPRPDGVCKAHGSR